MLFFFRDFAFPQACRNEMKFQKKTGKETEIFLKSADSATGWGGGTGEWVRGGDTFEKGKEKNAWASLPYHTRVGVLRRRIK